MAIGRNDKYVQLRFTADTFCKRQKRENSMVGPGFMSGHGDLSFFPNLGIAVDWVSCPDTDIGVLTTRFPRASCFKETHVFCSRNMGVHVQCTCAKKLVSSNFAKIMYNYVWKKNMLSRLAISGNVWGGSTSSDVLAVHNYNPKKKTHSFLEKNIQLYGHW